MAFLMQFNLTITAAAAASIIEEAESYIEKSRTVALLLLLLLLSIRKFIYHLGFHFSKPSL